MNLLELFKDGNINLILIRDQKYKSKRDKLISDMNTTKKPIAYITFNQTSKNILEHFKKNSIDETQISFIDGISRSIGISETIKNCKYTDKPDELDKIFVEIKSIIDFKDPHFFIIDNLSTLFLYTEEQTIFRFTHNIIEYLRSLDKQVFIFMLEKDFEKKSSKGIQLFVDQTITFI